MTKYSIVPPLPPPHHRWAAPGAGTSHFGSTVSTSVNVDLEQNNRSGKAASTISELNIKVRNNSKLTENTKLRVYEACVLSSLLHGSETWTTYKR